MTESVYHTELWLPGSRPEVFTFFADPANLEAITPPWLNFVTLTPLPLQMRAGALIDYRLRIHGIPLRWRTEITVWEPPGRFVDEQKRGPYRLWIHEHRFEERDCGTLMTDHVRYRAPGGALIERLFVRRDIESIFAHRRQKLRETFAPAAA
jgi:ligand-binding SRPBCC domain-containing protein